MDVIKLENKEGDFLKSGKVSIRRFFLNVSILGLIIGIIVLLSVVFHNLLLKKTTGIVVDYEISEYNYRINGVESVEERKHPIVEYESIENGIKQSNFYWLDGDEYNIGDTVEVYVDKDNWDEAVMPTGYTVYIVFYILPFVLLMLICKKAFKDYKRDFLERYHKSIKVTVIIEIVAIGFSLLWQHICSVKQYGGMMPGLDALGDFLFMCIVDAIAILSILVIWIVTGIKFMRHQKE